MISGFCLFVSPIASAEYRAYQIKIINTESSKEQLLITTFDQIQYPQYYPLGKNEVAEYVTSWMCRGRTGGFKKICKNPREDQLRPNLPSQSPGNNPSPTSPKT